MFLSKEEEGVEFDLVFEGFEPTEKEEETLLWLGTILERDPAVSLRLLASIREPVQQALNDVLNKE